MIKAVIIDDEPHCSERLERLLRNHCGQQIALAGTFNSLASGIAGIGMHQPGLVFLDVQLQGSTGFDLLQQLPQIDFQVIFTTAFEQYAVQAFRFSALDYLLKPIDAAELQQAVGRLRSSDTTNALLLQQLSVLHTHLFPTRDLPKKISVPTMYGFEFVTVHELTRCEADVNYTRLFIRGQTPMLVSRTLKEFESLLEPSGFFRVHHSHLVNLAHVQKYHKGKGGYIILTDGTEIEVSTRRKEAFLQRMKSV